MRLDYRFYTDEQIKKLMRNAKGNCVGMLGVILISFILVGTALLTGSLGFAESAPNFWTLGTIFAVIYVPMRWEIIMRLPRSYRILGLGSGIVLMGLAAIVLTAGILLSLASR